MNEKSLYTYDIQRILYVCIVSVISKPLWSISPLCACIVYNISKSNI